MSGPGITNFPDGMIAAGRTKATVVMGDHIPIGDSEDGNKVKVAPMEAVYNLIAGTPPETLDTLQKLASAINNDPAFHTTLATALSLKQNASNAMTTDTAQNITATKTFRSPFITSPTSTANYPVFSIGAGTELLWYLQYQPTSKTLRWFTPKEGLYPSPMQFLWDSDGKVRADFPECPLVSSPSDADASQKAAPTAWVLDRISEALAALPPASGVPAGVICMWSGTIATVPTGWNLCDGTNGTPDLVDRFVVAAGSKAGGDKYDPGDTGGLDSVTLTLTQVPAHTHAGTTNPAGGHGHDAYYWDGVSTGSGPMIDKRDNVNNNWDALSSPVSPVSDHAHGFTTDSKGGGQSHENRPPYYALAFIMKL